jgi:hypothetical protein
MTFPYQSDNMVFKDSLIFVQFRFDDAALRFQMQNVSRQQITVEWGKALIGVKNKFAPVRYSGNYYTTEKCAAQSTLPPLGYVLDFLIPEASVYKDGSTWKERDLFPTTDKQFSRGALQSFVGTPVALQLPIIVGKTERQYTFGFTVSNVSQIPWEAAKLPRRPTPPAKEVEITSTDEYITAGVVLGVVGIVAVLLSQKQSPPSE